MTLLLEQAFSEAKKLGSHEQDALASIILEEMIAERKWDESFARSQDQLAALADEALNEYRKGNTKPLTFN
jgi:hypothetical protein